jgi:hypothetical protein
MCRSLIRDIHIYNQRLRTQIAHNCRLKSLLTFNLIFALPTIDHPNVVMYAFRNADYAVHVKEKLETGEENLNTATGEVYYYILAFTEKPVYL